MANLEVPVCHEGQEVNLYSYKQSNNDWPSPCSMLAANLCSQSNVYTGNTLNVGIKPVSINVYYGNP